MTDNQPRFTIKSILAGRQHAIYDNVAEEYLELEATCGSDLGHLCALLNALHAGDGDPRYDTIILRAKKGEFDGQMLGLWRELAYEVGKWVVTANQDRGNYAPATLKIDSGMDVTYENTARNWPTKLKIRLTADLGYESATPDGLYRVVMPTMEFIAVVRNNGIVKAPTTSQSNITPAVRKAIQGKPADEAFETLKRRWKATITPIEEDQETLL